MALLTVKQRNEYFKILGLGEYNKSNILKLQKKYFVRKKDQDSIYGRDTDALLRHLYNCRNLRNFSPLEFKCECGGRYCTGYPTWMKANTLQMIQRIRTFYGKPVYITSALRCTRQNSLDGGVANSKHKQGKAIDFYIAGETITLNNRKKLIDTIKKWDNFDYAYCWGYNSLGNNIYAPNMGTSIHIQTK